VSDGPEKKKDADGNQQQAAEQAAGTRLSWSAIRHFGLLPLTLRALIWIARRSCGGGRGRWIDVAFCWSQGGREKNGANDDKDDRKGTPEAKTVASKFTQKKKNADRSDDCRTHKTANGASTASAAKLIAH
jgi:hypothetical protein